ncbi:hypothetical protein MSAN_02376100 [Mycena sanguinolenta]|uniref:Uncharacterized protein n=1 Tax=Mycena sanguinolenta TaxID=230812 RepID=A0A8H6X5F8_9AGAR|nr:hypothetical protein MSAN_02376100 [Mycena sanguinolenta]
MLSLSGVKDSDDEYTNINAPRGIRRTRTDELEGLSLIGAAGPPSASPAPASAPTLPPSQLDAAHAHAQSYRLVGRCASAGTAYASTSYTAYRLGRHQRRLSPRRRHSSTSHPRLLLVLPPPHTHIHPNRRISMDSWEDGESPATALRRHGAGLPSASHPPSALGRFTPTYAHGLRHLQASEDDEAAGPGGLAYTRPVGGSHSGLGVECDVQGGERSVGGMCGWRAQVGRRMRCLRHLQTQEKQETEAEAEQRITVKRGLVHPHLASPSPAYHHLLRRALLALGPILLVPVERLWLIDLDVDSFGPFTHTSSDLLVDAWRSRIQLRSCFSLCLRTRLRSSLACQPHRLHSSLAF